MGMQEEKGSDEVKRNAGKDILFIQKKIKLLAVILFYSAAKFPLPSRQRTGNHAHDCRKWPPECNSVSLPEQL